MPTSPSLQTMSGFQPTATKWSLNPSTSGQAVNKGHKNILKQLFGDKPEVPPLEEFTPEQIQFGTLESNIAAAPKAAQLARLSQEQIRAMMNFAIPGFTGLAGSVPGMIGGWMAGLLSPDTARAIRASRASGAISGGYGGGERTEALVARDLGLTSMGIQQMGLSSLQNWTQAMQSLYAPSQALYSSSFFTPQQYYGIRSAERGLQFSRNWLINQIAAMPNPIMRGVYDTIMNLANSYLGGQYNPSKGYQAPPSQGLPGSSPGGGPGGGQPGVGYGSGGWGGWSSTPYDTENAAAFGGSGATGSAANFAIGGAMMGF